MSRQSSKELSSGGPLLSVEEAAEHLRIAVWTLRHWVSDRKIPFVKLGSRVRFRQPDLDRFITQNLVKASHGK